MNHRTRSHTIRRTLDLRASLHLEWVRVNTGTGAEFHAEWGQPDEKPTKVVVEQIDMARVGLSHKVKRGWVVMINGRKVSPGYLRALDAQVAAEDLLPSHTA